MFRAVRFDVTSRVRPGKNRLAVSFRPTVLDREMPAWSIIGDDIRDSDNYFDLADRETTTIFVRNDAVPLGPHDVTVRWR